MFISLIITVVIVALFLSYGSYKTKSNPTVKTSKKKVKKFLDYLK